VAEDLDLAGPRALAALPVASEVAQSVRPAALDGPPRLLGHAEPLVLLVAAVSDVPPAGPGVARLAEAAQDVQRRRRVSGARSELPAAAVSAAPPAGPGVARLASPMAVRKALDEPVVAQRGLRAPLAGL
jgi:hypothetical protein